MIGEKIVEQKPVTLAEVKDLLSARKKEKDLSYEQDLAFKYSKRFSHASLTQTKKLYSELKGIKGLDKETTTKVIDLLPVKKEVLQLLLTKESALDDASMQKILDLCSKYKK